MTGKPLTCYLTTEEQLEQWNTIVASFEPARSDSSILRELISSYAAQLGGKRAPDEAIQQALNKLAADNQQIKADIAEIKRRLGEVAK